MLTSSIKNKFISENNTLIAAAYPSLVEPGQLPPVFVFVDLFKDLSPIFFLEEGELLGLGCGWGRRLEIEEVLKNLLPGLLLVAGALSPLATAWSLFRQAVDVLNNRHVFENDALVRLEFEVAHTDY